MASTRNKNTLSDYCLEQKSLKISEKYKLYEYSQNGMAYQPGIPCGGSAPASFMARDQLSYNPVQIESALFGIGSTNLVKPQQPVHGRLKILPMTSFFDINKVIMPEPLIIEKNQRDGPIEG